MTAEWWQQNWLWAVVPFLASLAGGGLLFAVPRMLACLRPHREVVGGLLLVLVGVTGWACGSVNWHLNTRGDTPQPRTVVEKDADYQARLDAARERDAADRETAWMGKIPAAMLTVASGVLTVAGIFVLGGRGKVTEKRKS